MGRYSIDLKETAKKDLRKIAKSFKRFGIKKIEEYLVCYTRIKETKITSLFKFLPICFWCYNSCFIMCLHCEIIFIPSNYKVCFRNIS